MTAFWPFDRNLLDGQVDVLASHVKDTIQALDKMGKTARVFGVIPHFSFPADGCAVRKAMFPNRDISCVLAPQASAELMKLDKALSESLGSSYVPLLDLFCDLKHDCSAFALEMPAFSDAHHLNADFASKVAEEIGPRAGVVSQTSPSNPDRAQIKP